jgi:hypothetical protein
VRGEARDDSLTEWDVGWLMMISHPDHEGRLWRMRWSVERVKGRMRFLGVLPRDLTALPDPLRNCLVRNPAESSAGVEIDESCETENVEIRYLESSS